MLLCPLRTIECCYNKIKAFHQLKVKIMNIQLKPELEQIIEAQIATGRYSDPEEVISKALKLLLEWEQGYQQWVEETREKLKWLLNS